MHLYTEICAPVIHLNTKSLDLRSCGIERLSTPQCRVDSLRPAARHIILESTSTGQIFPTTTTLVRVSESAIYKLDCRICRSKFKQFNFTLLDVSRALHVRESTGSISIRFANESSGDLDKTEGKN